MYFFKNTWQKAVFWILVAGGLLTRWGYPLYALLAFIAVLELVRFFRDERDWTRLVTAALFSGTAASLFRFGADLNYSAASMVLVGLCVFWGIALPVFMRPEKVERSG